MNIITSQHTVASHAKDLDFPSAILDVKFAWSSAVADPEMSEWVGLMPDGSDQNSTLASGGSGVPQKKFEKWMFSDQS